MMKQLILALTLGGALLATSDAQAQGRKKKKKSTTTTAAAAVYTGSTNAPTAYSQSVGAYNSANTCYFNDFCIQAAKNGNQTITIPALLTAGNWRITYTAPNGAVFQTANIAWNATAAGITAACAAGFPANVVVTCTGTVAGGFDTNLVLTFAFTGTGGSGYQNLLSAIEWNGITPAGTVWTSKYVNPYFNTAANINADTTGYQAVVGANVYAAYNQSYLGWYYCYLANYYAYYAWQYALQLNKTYAVAYADTGVTAATAAFTAGYNCWQGCLTNLTATSLVRANPATGDAYNIYYNSYLTLVYLGNVKNGG